ncbi:MULTISPECIES: patatin-like phospholipase family protein [unclassified Neorhizobium]|uniref:patatin-like phospholipase family protein n=1 Tax=unclassified Neorhizobium TaxID=2629175 RepID=UPI001FF2FE45|nr:MULTISPECIES: patatin-like phospholipase family protein [unclassified Neorhizobium]MCJ9670344.1 patatin-like phospholipase family protein [Neorhizobium sp. SHOUNA12B]MCJ9746599.1 patatin-like phospholipase family protein [Neorhizobium sp. SHOUNA12A]
MNEQDDKNPNTLPDNSVSDAGQDTSTTLTFAEMFSKEKATVGAVRKRGKPDRLSLGKEKETASAKPQVGLALSGGGVRSAAFSLGVLQALSANKVFESVAFLSTVSGGGYTGAALVAAMERDDGKFPFETVPERKDGFEPADIADSKLVRALRDRSRYLMPNGKFDLVVSFGIILRGLMVNATMVAATLFFLSALTLFFNPIEDSLSHAWPSYLVSNSSWLTPYLDVEFLFSRIAGVLFLVWLVFWALRRSFNTAASSDPGSKSARATGWAMLGIAIIFLAELQVPILRQALFLRTDPKGFHVSWAWLPQIMGTLATGTGILALSWRWLTSQIQAAAKDPAWTGFFRKVLSQLTLFALALALPTLIYIAYLWLTVTGIRVNDGFPNAGFALMALRGLGAILWFVILSLSALMIWLSVWASNIGPIGETLPLSTWKRRDAGRRKPSIKAAIGLVAVPVALAIALWFFPTLYRKEFFEIFAMGAAYLTIAVVLTFVAGFFTENANSLHQLYRDRLNEAFSLGLENNKAFPLSQLGAPFKSGALRRPYPIINTAVNLQGSKQNRRGRNADFFVFTPEHAGSDATGYVPIAEFQIAEPHIDLASAAAISGAAVSSAMGRVGVPILAPTLALLNIRLGYWVRNPKFLTSAALAKTAKLKDWKLSYLFYEMFGLLHEERSKVLLSDGGHIDNLGLYQLLKRRCDVIIVSDAEADPAMNFGALVDVERFARIDLGVRFDLPWQAIRDSAIKRQNELQKGEAATVKASPHGHAAIGKINYPKTAGGPGAPALEEKEGILLYVKSSMTGDERSYVLDYERRFPRFPHEATSDQFFSEEQFEAYRALGFHAMDRALTSTDETVPWRTLLDRLLADLAKK